MALPLLLLLFLLPAVTVSIPPQYNTLLLKSLPIPHPLTPAEEIQIGDSPATASESLRLHHLDSLAINSSPEFLFNLRLQRDAKRAHSLFSVSASARHHGNGDFSSSVISGLAQGSGEYFARFGIGTPPRYSYFVLDTGSNVVWIQCSPCRKCYAQTDRLFNPARSKSYSSVACNSPLCRRLDEHRCDARRNSCQYQVAYGDGSFTAGDFATETLTFRGKRIPKFAFGCGHDNEGLFVGAAGLLGLGRDNLSFPSQTGPTFNHKFSYCLVDRSSSSKPSSLIFGNSSISRKAIFTPLLTNPKLQSFYYLDLIGISVGGRRVPGISPQLFKFNSAGYGGVIIDSGTSVTRLTNVAYVAFRNAFRAGASALKPSTGFSLFDTCFDLSGKKVVKVPTVTFNFAGADVSLPAENYLIPVDANAKFCFAFAGTPNKLSIIGNIQQQGFRVGYDLANSRVGFTPGGC